MYIHLLYIHNIYTLYAHFIHFLCTFLCILMQVIHSVYTLSHNLEIKTTNTSIYRPKLIAKIGFLPFLIYTYIYTYYKPTLTCSLTGKKIRHLLFTADVFFGFPNPLHKYAFQGKGFPILLNTLSHHSTH